MAWQNSSQRTDLQVEPIPDVLLNALKKKTDELLELKARIVEANEKMFSDCLEYLFNTKNSFVAVFQPFPEHKSILLARDLPSASGIYIHSHSFHSLVTSSSYNQIIERSGYCDDVYQKMRKNFPRNLLDEIKQTKALVSEYKKKDKAIVSFCRSMSKQFSVDILPHYRLFQAKYA